uniref:Uncharacterized protein n=1 Tax=Romanomermis culicivorax TaxID=13658 RepID=A0A915KU99_ROMCU
MTSAAITDDEGSAPKMNQRQFRMISVFNSTPRFATIVRMVDNCECKHRKSSIEMINKPINLLNQSSRAAPSGTGRHRFLV